MHLLSDVSRAASTGDEGTIEQGAVATGTFVMRLWTFDICHFYLDRLVITTLAVS